MLYGTSKITDGILAIGGVSAADMGKKFGTPLFCLDEELIRQNCRRYRRAFCEGNHNRVAYAGKALLTIAICQIVEQEGLYLDVVSGGELWTAMKAQFPAERIYFHGNNKSEQELRLALSLGVGTIVVDNLYELTMLLGLAKEEKQQVSILLRVALGVDAKTHKYIQTGQHDSKFGFALGSEEMNAAIETALSHEYCSLLGYHSHIGSQILAISGFEQAVEVMYDLVAANIKAFGFVPGQLNFGGGLGIRYTDEEADVPLETLTAMVLNKAREKNAELGVDPVLVIEPGRSIVGNAGTTLYTIGSIKEVKNIRTFVAVDGGMTDNPRPALYSARYECAVANKMDAPRDKVYSIAGRCCESGDMLIWDVNLPAVTSGDLLAVFSTGAYNYSMASNYNRLPRPAMVLVGDGHAKLIVERETYDDVVARDRKI
jgi:diaminopimelate decarboxylase